jgi:protein-S-isoprenylcysteine O-methyltransferase Ste14
LLLAAYLFAPPIGGRWPLPLRILGWIAGPALVATGVTFFTYGVVQLGSALSPFPKPNARGTLRTGGIYGCVRHPIYGGLVMAAAGLGLTLGSTSRLALAPALLAFFGAKSAVEEQWLVERYPDYPSYQARVRRILPGLW